MSTTDEVGSVRRVTENPAAAATNFWQTVLAPPLNLSAAASFGSGARSALRLTRCSD